MTRQRTTFFALLIMLGIANVHAQTQDPAPQVQLNALLDEDLDATLRRNPIQATVRGVPGYNHLLPDLSLATLERERARERRALERLNVLDAKALRGQDRISYELLLDKMELAVEAQQFTDADALVLTTLGGLHNVLPRAAQVTPFHTPEDYRDYIKRIRAAPKLAEDTIARLKPGVTAEKSPSLRAIERAEAGQDIGHRTSGTCDGTRDNRGQHVCGARTCTTYPNDTCGVRMKGQAETSVSTWP